MVNLAVHPQFAFLKPEPRFQKLVAQIGLSVSARQAKQGSESTGSRPRAK
jgi:hypothetical protein